MIVNGYAILDATSLRNEAGMPSGTIAFLLSSLSINDICNSGNLDGGEFKNWASNITKVRRDKVIYWLMIRSILSYILFMNNLKLLR